MYHRKKSLLLVAATSSKCTSENNVSAITDSTLTRTKEALGSIVLRWFLHKDKTEYGFDTDKITLVKKSIS